MPVLPLKKSDPSLGPETSWLQVPRRWPRCNNWWQKPKKKMKPKYYLYNLIYVICKLSGAIRNIFIIYTQLYYMYQYSLKDGSNCLFWKVGLELLSFFMKLLSLDMSFHFDGGVRTGNGPKIWLSDSSLEKRSPNPLQIHIVDLLNIWNYRTSLSHEKCPWD